MILELTRLLAREAKEFARIRTGEEPSCLMSIGASIPRDGTEPYLASFRVSVFDPQCGAHREYTVTVTESRSRR